MQETGRFAYIDCQGFEDQSSGVGGIFERDRLVEVVSECKVLTQVGHGRLDRQSDPRLFLPDGAVENTVHTLVSDSSRGALDITLRLAAFSSTPGCAYQPHEPPDQIILRWVASNTPDQNA